MGMSQEDFDTMLAHLELWKHRIVKPEVKPLEIEEVKKP